MKNLALLLLRLTTGGLLVTHGYVKLFGGKDKRPPEAVRRVLGPNFDAAVEEGGPKAFGRTLAALGVPQPEFAAYLSGATEFAGGLALIAGYHTRLTALPVMFNMLVAINRVHAKNGLYGQGGYELPCLLAANSLALWLAGPGAISLDRLCSSSKKKPDEPKAEA